jgi:hypothetical protein
VVSYNLILLRISRVFRMETIGLERILSKYHHLSRHDMTLAVRCRHLERTRALR